MPFILGVSCLAAGAYYLVTSAQSFDYATDKVSPWEERTNRIRAALPPDVFATGYLEKADIPGVVARYDDLEFFIVQYGMAPVVVSPGFGPEWTIGNFGNAAPVAAIRTWLDGELGSFDLQDLGFGIYLIHDLEG